MQVNNTRVWGTGTDTISTVREDHFGLFDIRAKLQSINLLNGLKRHHIDCGHFSVITDMKPVNRLGDHRIITGTPSERVNFYVGVSPAVGESLSLPKNMSVSLINNSTNQRYDAQMIQYGVDMRSALAVFQNIDSQGSYTLSINESQKPAILDSNGRSAVNLSELHKP